MPTGFDRGQKVRVTFEGYFNRLDFDGEAFFDDKPGNDREFYANVFEQMPGFKIEAIEPDLLDGGIYQDADGDLFKYYAESKRFMEIGGLDWRYFDYPTRPLVRLVPETSRV